MSTGAKGKTLDYYLSLPYKAEITHDEDGWFAKVPELPGCMTWADSYAALGPMIEDAKFGWIEDALEHGDPVPEPRGTYDFSGKVNLRMPKGLHRDLARQAEDEGVSLNQLMVSHLARGAGSVPFADQSAATSPKKETVAADKPISREWPREVDQTLTEYEELLGEGDITELASQRIVTNSANLLQEFSNDMVAISERVVEIGDKLVADTKKRRYPLRKLRELETTFENLTTLFHSLEPDFKRLEAFCQRAIEEHKVRFGDQSDQKGYNPVREVEMILDRARAQMPQLDE